jgi:hypothetical protein
MEKGLFRLWLVGSVVWVAVAAWAFQSMGYALNDCLSVIAGPPVAVGLLVAALVWAFKGFAR